MLGWCGCSFACSPEVSHNDLKQVFGDCIFFALHDWMFNFQIPIITTAHYAANLMKSSSFVLDYYCNYFLVKRVYTLFVDTIRDAADDFAR